MTANLAFFLVIMSRVFSSLFSNYFLPGCCNYWHRLASSQWMKQRRLASLQRWMGTPVELLLQRCQALHKGELSKKHEFGAAAPCWAVSIAEEGLWMLLRLQQSSCDRAGTGQSPAGTGQSPAGTGQSPLGQDRARWDRTEPAGTGQSPAGTGQSPLGQDRARLGQDRARWDRREPAGTGQSPAGTGESPAGTGQKPGWDRTEPGWDRTEPGWDRTEPGWDRTEPGCAPGIALLGDPCPALPSCAPALPSLVS
uniref:Uncharacterized protein n=1 Tax=Malurus cyaneus samueli TaxID=2593467 RepID=A0A8C5TTM7_9PASS